MEEEGVATSLFGLQAALATSVDLRCYLVLSQTVDSAVTLDLADFDHHMTWSLSTFNHWPESNGGVTYITILQLYLLYLILLC